MIYLGPNSSRFHLSHQVDREERPDVDRLYMTFLQATTGGGGWPMSICESRLCIYATVRAAVRSRSPRAVIAERLPCLNGGERGACAPPSAIVAGSQGPATVGAQRRTVEHAAALYAARDRHSAVACSCFSCRGSSGSALVHCRLSALGESTAGPPTTTSVKT